MNNNEDIYYVYSHWLDNKCFYVGHGKGIRPWNFSKYARSEEWSNITDGRKEEVDVKIMKTCEDKISAFFFENLYTRKLFEKYDLTNKNIASICKHSEETKKKISIKNSGKANGMYGEIPTNAILIIAENKNGEKHIFRSQLDCTIFFKNTLSIKVIMKLLKGEYSQKAEKLGWTIKKA